MLNYDLEPVRLGLIGCGGMGTRHALAIAGMAKQGLRSVELVALCDTDAERRDLLANRIEQAGSTRPSLHEEFASLLDRQDIDAIDIVLPTSMHHSLILDALEAGKHVLVEKPLALTVKACDLIVAAAARTGRVVAVAENYRRIASNRAIGDLVHNGALGPLHTMYVRNFASPDMSMEVEGRTITPPKWYRDRTRAGGYHVLEMGVHEADLQRYWFGDIDTVSAETRRFDGPMTIDPRIGEDAVMATLTFTSGFVSNLAFSSAIAGIDVADRTLIGSEVFAHSGAWHAWQDGAIRHADGYAQPLTDAVACYLSNLSQTDRRRLLPSGAWAEDEPVSLATRPLSYGVGLAIHDFASAIREGREAEISAVEGRIAVATCYAMEESAHSGRPVRLRDVLAGHVAEAQIPLNQAIGLI